ncbi:MAG: hypothetical protein AAGE01_20675 [Pseudomonadota bacterium]
MVDARHQVLVLGSGPSIAQLDRMDSSPWTVVAMNRAWSFRPDRVDYVVHMDALPGSKRPPAGRYEPGRVVSYAEYVEAVRHYARRFSHGESDDWWSVTGGLIHFSTSYWVMHALNPGRIGYLGCDFNYAGGTTHFYGRGQSIPAEEPHREPLGAYFDIQARFCDGAGVSLLNLSDDPDSLLPYPRHDQSGFAEKRRRLS